MTEPAIRPGVHIQIVRFRVKQGEAQTLIDAVLREVNGWVRHIDGFISANFHVSEDGQHIINYAQWESEAAFNTFLAHGNHGDLRQAIEGAAPLAMEGDAFRLVQSVLPS